MSLRRRPRWRRPSAIAGSLPEADAADRPFRDRTLQPLFLEPMHHKSTGEANEDSQAEAPPLSRTGIGRFLGMIREARVRRTHGCLDSSFLLEEFRSPWMNISSGQFRGVVLPRLYGRPRVHRSPWAAISRSRWQACRTLKARVRKPAADLHPGGWHDQADTAKPTRLMRTRLPEAFSR